MNRKLTQNLKRTLEMLKLHEDEFGKQYEKTSQNCPHCNSKMVPISVQTSLKADEGNIIKFMCISCS